MTSPRRPAFFVFNSRQEVVHEIQWKVCGTGCALLHVIGGRPDAIPAMGRTETTKTGIPHAGSKYYRNSSANIIRHSGRHGHRLYQPPSRLQSPRLPRPLAAKPAFGGGKLFVANATGNPLDEDSFHLARYGGCQYRSDAAFCDLRNVCHFYPIAGSTDAANAQARRDTRS